MVDCRKCQRFNACYFDDGDCIGFVPKTMTNADRIRSMTDEELAEFIEGAMCPPQCCVKRVYECQKNECVPCWLAWLKEEVKHDGT